MHPLSNSSNIFNLFLKYNISLISELGKRLYDGSGGTGISFLHFNSYYLTGILSVKNSLKFGTIFGFTDIKYHIKWIRQVLNKHVRKYIVFRY